MKTMIKSFFLFSLMLSVLGINAQVDGTLSTSLNNLQFSTSGLYDRIETNYGPASKTGVTTQFKFGEPEIPVVQKKYLLPLDASGISVQVTDTRTQALSGVYNIYPEQYPIPLDGGESPEWVDPKPEIYQSNNAYPGKVIEIEREESTMGYKIVTVNIYPLSYTPLAQSLELYTSIEFELTYTTGVVGVSMPLSISSYRNEIVTNFIQSSVSNPEDFNVMLGGATGVIESNNLLDPLEINPLPFANGILPDYIIITSEAFNVQELQDFAYWKTKTGIPTIIVTIEQINQVYSGVDQGEKIFYYLKDVYNNWGSMFVLLGGDTDIIPARFAYFDDHIDLWRPCELYFSDVDKATDPGYNWNANGNAQFGEDDDNIDGSPDHFVGRAVFNNNDELNAFINKTISYEKAQVPSLDYYNNLLFITGYLRLNHPTKPDYSVAEDLNDLRDEIIFYNTNINTWELYDDDDLSSAFNYEWDEILNKQNALDNLDHGGSTFGNYFNLVYHMDHAGSTSMGTSSQVAHESINRTDVDGLDNLPYSHIFYTGSCSPNSFDKDAVGDHYFYNEDGAGVAFIGSTATSWGSDLDYFEYFCNGLYVNNYDNTISNLLYYASTGVDYRKRIALLGDPTLPIWTNTPDNLLVTLNPNAVNTGENTINVAIDNLSLGTDALVCFFKDDEIYARETIAGTGSTVYANIDCTPDTEGNILVTVTAKNHIPYETTIPVDYNPGIHLFASDVTIDDDATAPSNGNNDGLVDAGETTELIVSLTNNGNSSATGGNAILSYIDPELNGYVTVTQSQSGFGNIAYHETEACTTAFVINISTDTPDQYIAAFELSISDGQLNTYTDEIYLEIHAPEPQLISNEFTATLVGDEHTIDPEDHVKVTFEFYNGGTGMATGLSGELTNTITPPPYVQTINPSNQAFGNIISHSSGTNQSFFEFDVYGVPIYNGTETIEMQLTITDEFGKEWPPIDINYNKPPDIEGILWESTNNSITLFWDPILDEKGYNVYQSIFEAGPYTKINTQIITGFSGYTEYGLNPRTIYYYKISCVSNEGIEGNKSAPQETWTSLPLHANWPIKQINSDDFGGRTEGSPMTADFDADGKKEIYFTTSDFGGTKGGIFGFYHDGDEIFNIDGNPTNYGGFYKYDNAGSSATPAIGDIENDNIFELISTTKGSDDVFDEAKTFVHTTIGNDEPEPFPDMLFSPFNGGHDEFKGSVLSDIDNDGDLEIISKGTWGSAIYVFQKDEIEYSNYPGWPLNIGLATGFGMPVAADIDNVGYKELIFGFNNGNYQGTTFDAGIYAFNYDGTSYIPNANGLLFKNGTVSGAYDKMDGSLSIADINGDGHNEIICVSSKIISGNPVGLVFILDKDGDCITGWEYDFDNNYSYDHTFSITNNAGAIAWLPTTCIADLNGDNDLEIILASDDHIYTWENDGSPFISPIYVQYLETKTISPLVADIDEDDDMEIIVASNNGSYGAIHCYDINGDRVLGWPLRLPGIFSTPCIDDIDNDGKNEIIATTGVEVHVWDTEGDADKVEWGKYRHDRYNSGVYGDFCPKSSTPLTISTIEEWTDPKILQSDLIIEDQAKLTIYDNVALPSGAKIIVEEGGQLILDGAVITKACTDNWSGIEVWGDPTSSLTADQGYLTLKNGAIIEHADVAIRNHRYLGTTIDKQGGIVKAYDATFLNNKKACHFQGYDYSSKIYIKDCEFINDDSHNALSGFYYFMEIRNMKGINIVSCEFKNNTSQDMKGSGIYSYRSGVKIYSTCTGSSIPCTSWDEGMFNNLWYGVLAMGQTGGEYVDIRNTYFVGCFRGVYMSGMDGARVTSNNFELPSAGHTSYYGLYMNNSTAYHIEDNLFTGPSSIDLGGIGLYIANSGEEWNQVYNNTFSNLIYGTVAFGENRNSTGTNGLCIECNDYENNENDITVNGRLNVGHGIAYDQGHLSANDTLPAGNTFTDGFPDLVYNYYNTTGLGYLRYIYHSHNSTGEKLIPNPYYNPFTMQVLGNLNSSYTKARACPSKLDGGGEIEDDKEKVTSADTEIGTTEAQLETLVDGGDTEQTNMEVMTSTPPEALDVYQELIDESPYLSDTVMKTAIYKETVLPNAMIRDVLVANPQSAKSSEVISAMDDRFDPMPEYMKNQVMQGLNVISAKEQMESELAYWQYKRGEHFNNLYQYFRKDTLFPTLSSDSLELLLFNDQTLSSKYKLAFYYYEQQDYINVDIVLTNIPNNFDLDDKQLSLHQRYVNLFDQLEALNGAMPEEGSDVAVQLDILAENDANVPGAIARDILSNAGLIQYDEPIILPEILKSSEITFDDLKNNSSVPEVLNVYPNPANNYIIIEYNADGYLGQVLLSIYDLSGKPVYAEVYKTTQDQKVINTADWTSGVYLVNLVVDGVPVKSTKVTVK